MRLLALCAATAAFAATAVTPAGAYEERPMRLPSTGSGVSAASSEPSTWLVAAERGAADAVALARRFGAVELRAGSV
jgi:hypothetical protein